MKNNSYDPDTFNFFSLIKILSTSYKSIIITTIAFALIGIFYTSKIPTEYSAESMLEIGENKLNQNMSSNFLIENTEDLINRLKIEYGYKKNNNTYSYSFEPVEKRLLKITIKSNNEDEVIQTLNTINAYVLERHNSLLNAEYNRIEDEAISKIDEAEKIILQILESKLINFDKQIQGLNFELKNLEKIVVHNLENNLIDLDKQIVEVNNSFKYFEKDNYLIKLKSLEESREKINRIIFEKDFEKLDGSLLEPSELFFYYIDVINNRESMIRDLKKIQTVKQNNSSTTILYSDNPTKSSSSLKISIFLSSIIGFIFGSVSVLLIHFYRTNKNKYLS